MNTYREPAREIPVTHAVDVVVAGGGTAGTAAAVCAARLGLAVVMVEQTAIPGGMLTQVTHWLSDFANKGGFAREFITHLRDSGICQWPYHNLFRTALYLDELVDASGVRHLYLARVAAPMRDGDGRVCGVIVESKSGRHAVRAKVVIDATGDGDVAALAGASFVVGRESDGACQAISLSHLLTNYTGPAISNPDFLALLDRAATAAGNHYRIPYDRARIQTLAGTRQCIWNGTPHVCGHDPLDAASLSDAMVALRRQCREFHDTLKFHTKEFADLEFGPIAGLPGVRESRRMLCDEAVSYPDAVAGHRRPGGLFLVTQAIDIHKCHEGEPDIYVEKIKPYHIPYGALLPKGVENLLVVGRCIGGDHQTLASYRIIADCFAMGEAAAIAARVAIDENRTPRQIPAEQVAAKMAELGYEQ
ncbi:MAG: FAD-dependent oxidoreductase [Lentisphaeria bacterium]|jgi:hypothetical protein|nr:FAD-dependent oxidoreductase [Lentisphaeria bacterium]